MLLAAGSTAALAAAGRTVGARHSGVADYPAGARAATCAAPALPGSVIDVSLTDMGARMADSGYGGMGYGGMMGRGSSMMGSAGWWPPGMMSVQASPTSVPAGSVSLRVTNSGALTHELVVLPLSGDARPGQRAVGSDGAVSEAGSLGEASDNCGAGSGDGIKPGGVSWTTLDLKPGRYELVCNVPGHYAAGMHSEIDVTSG